MLYYNIFITALLLAVSVLANNKMTFYGCPDECYTQERPSCGKGSIDTDYFAALSTSLPHYKEYCGSHVIVMETKKNANKLVRAKIVDSCSSCEKYHIDLSKKAFSKLTLPKVGKSEIIWAIYDRDGNILTGPHYNSVSEVARSYGVDKDTFVNTFEIIAQKMAASHSTSGTFSISHGSSNKGITRKSTTSKKTTTRKTTTSTRTTTTTTTKSSTTKTTKSTTTTSTKSSTTTTKTTTTTSSTSKSSTTSSTTRTSSYEPTSTSTSSTSYEPTSTSSKTSTSSSSSTHKTTITKIVITLKPTEIEQSIPTEDSQSSKTIPELPDVDSIPDPVVDDPIIDDPDVDNPAPAPVIDEPAPIVDEPDVDDSVPAPVIDEPDVDDSVPAPVIDDPAPIVDDPAPIVDGSVPSTGNNPTNTNNDSITYDGDKLAPPTQLDTSSQRQPPVLISPSTNEKADQKDKSGSSVGIATAILGTCLGASGVGLLFLKKKNPSKFEALTRRATSVRKSITRTVSRRMTNRLSELPSSRGGYLPANNNMPATEELPRIAVYDRQAPPPARIQTPPDQE